MIEKSLLIVGQPLIR